MAARRGMAVRRCTVARCRRRILRVHAPLRNLKIFRVIHLIACRIVTCLFRAESVQPSLSTRNRTIVLCIGKSRKKPKQTRRTTAGMSALNMMNLHILI